MFRLRGASAVLLAVIAASLTALMWCQRTPAPSSRPVALVSVSPDRIKLDGKRIVPQPLDVTYEIADPQHTTGATLEFNAPELGVLAQMDVPVQAAGAVRFDVQPRFHSLGPVVRLRAACPAGTTDWYTMGTTNADEGNAGDTLRITGVRPNAIPWMPGDREDPKVRDAGTVLTISGSRLTGACTIEAQVDGAAAELKNLSCNKEQAFEGVLMYRDVGYQLVSPRYVELTLRIYGQGPSKVAIAKLKFDGDEQAARVSARRP